MDMNFHERLRKEMTSKGVGEEGLAERVGVSEQTVQRWIRGGQNPPKKTIRKIAEVLGCSYAYLIDGELNARQDREDEIDAFLRQEAEARGVPLDKVVMLLRAVEDRKKGMSETDRGILASVLDYVSMSLKNGKGNHGGEEVLSDEDL